MLGRSHDCFAPLHQQSGICCSFFTFLVFKPWLQCNVIIDTGEKLIHCNFIRKTSGRGLFVGACPVFQSCWQLLLWLFIRYQKGCRVLAAEHTVCRCAAIVTEPKQSGGWKIAGRHWSNSTDWLMLQQLCETRLGFGPKHPILCCQRLHLQIDYMHAKAGKVLVLGCCRWVRVRTLL